MFRKTFFIVMIVILLSQNGNAQKSVSRDTLLVAAREIINESAIADWLPLIQRVSPRQGQ